MGSHLSVLLVLGPVKCRLTMYTVFSKTLFTPAGIDIYIRSSPAQGSNGASTEQRQELLGKVITAVQASKAEGLGELAKKGFQVPGVV